jgi:acyl-CoA thioesterase-2
MSDSLQRLLEILDLERIETNLFRGQNPTDSRRRLFGGQVLAQGLVAALRTVEGRLAHSLHAYFLRPGDPRVPTVFEVDRVRDGGTFATRLVKAIQHGEAILNMSVSFQVDVEGLEHQIAMPAESGEPDGILYEDEMRSGVEKLGFAPPEGDLLFHPPVEIRTVGGLRMFEATSRPPHTNSWVRAKGRLPDDPAIHQCVLAYASDMTLLSNAINAHPIALASPSFQSASLDHAMWFHRPFRVDDWLLYVMESPVSARSRGFCRGTFFTRDGQLVASCAQEGLIRLRNGRA